MHFRDRQDAGRQLAERLEKFRGDDAIVFALPRGGVVLGREVARHLRAPLDLVITRKIGHPSNPEYAVCAVAEDGHMVCNEAERALLDPEWFARMVESEKQEAKRRRQEYLKGRKSPDVKEKTAIIVDDGIATGLTLKLAIQELKHRGPRRIVVAVPVAPRDSAEEIGREVDEFVALDVPLVYLGAVGAYYDEFSQVEDREVVKILEELATT
ncbi:MAG: phosphoribosyltransferase family protein [bacterium]|nr:phosphoribosyltransferase family protein [bacterium]MDZ4231482.1 phosphoribosyltransferase family protein [Patescibacteria group bacterium]